MRRIGSRLLQGVALNRKAGESSIVAACQIDSEMVVIAVVGKKTKWSPLGSERKAERLAKRLRDVEVGSVEIHMAEASGAGESAPSVASVAPLSA